MDLPTARFLWRLIDAGPCQRQHSAVAQQLHERYILGSRSGRRFEYDAGAIEHAKNILRSHNFPEAEPRAPLADRAAGRALPGISEKSGTLSPRQGLVAMRALGASCTLHGQELPARLHGFVALDLEEAFAVHCDILLYVENLETLKQLHRYVWLNAHRALAGQRVAAVYRGDGVFRPATGSRLLNERREPVWAFPDLDPAGLAFAAALPRFAGLALPWEQLDPLVRKWRRHDLYHTQIDQYRAVLESAAHADIQRAWQIVHRAEAGLPQEVLRDAV